MTAPVRDRPLGHGFPGAHFLDAEEIQLAVRVLQARSPSRFYGVQPQHLCDLFERLFSRSVGARHGVAVGSGTGALHVALAALGVGPGQEVIVPGYLWVATVAAVVHRGAIPVLCEIDDTYCLDPADLARKITPRTTVVIPVHMSGAAGDLSRICAVARAAGLRVLEDCAQAAGGSHDGRPLGSFGDAAIFSFQYTKAMTTGEGGMVVTSDDDLHRRCRAAHDIGLCEEPGREATVLWGLGAVMTELQAALGLAQLGKLPRIVGALRGAQRRLRAALAELPGAVVQLRRLCDEAGDNGSFLITRYADRETAARVAQRLIDLGLSAGPHGRLVHHFPDWGLHLYYNIPQLVRKLSNSPDGFPWTHPLNRLSQYDYGPGSLPRTDDLFARSVLQAVPANATFADVADMIEIYRRALS